MIEKLKAPSNFNVRPAVRFTRFMKISLMPAIIRFIHAGSDKKFSFFNTAQSDLKRLIKFISVPRLTRNTLIPNIQISSKD